MSSGRDMVGAASYYPHVRMCEKGNSKWKKARGKSQLRIVLSQSMYDYYPYYSYSDTYWEVA